MAELPTHTNEALNEGENPLENVPISSGINAIRDQTFQMLLLRSDDELETEVMKLMRSSPPPNNRDAPLTELELKEDSRYYDNLVSLCRPLWRNQFKPYMNMKIGEYRIAHNKSKRSTPSKDVWGTSEKKLNKTFAQFFADIDNALIEAGFTHDEVKNMTATQNISANDYKSEGGKKMIRAYRLLLLQGYYRNDITEI